MDYLHNKRSKFEFLSVIAVYIFCELAYSWALYFVSKDTGHLIPTVIDYSIKGIYTIPIWWLLFRKFRHFPAWQRYASHIVFLPLWIYAWINTYYWVCDRLDYGHLGGSNVAWDIYIPALFYTLQFGVFHLYDESYRLSQQEKKSLELSELALKSELTALKAQLNPHFLYNVFNTINASLPPKEEYTRELVAKLSDLFRYQLKASKLDRVPLEDEVEFIRTYLELEQARFGERLKIQWHIDEHLLEEKVPPMLLQPIVENAIRHGISPKIEGGIVQIDIREEEGAIRMNISDDGIGFGSSSHNNGTGVGLTNTRKMLNKLYGQSLYIEPNLPQGTQVRFYIPFENASLRTKVLT